jgi:CheY-like chemotaxis protein
LLVNERLSLVIEEPTARQLLYTDEAKASQILRNLISNALKFTEAGEVRVSAEIIPSQDYRPTRIAFHVTDTGIGIAEDDVERIFEEFVQVDGPLQRRVRGTGLGLPLSRRLARLLGGDVYVESRVGYGSKFTLELPVQYTIPQTEQTMPDFVADSTRLPVLVVEDDAVDRFLVERHLRDTPFQPCFASNLPEARVLLTRFVPAAIVLDVVLQGVEAAWNFMAELHTRNLEHIPVIIVSHVEDRAKAATLGARAYAQKPLRPGWLVAELERCTRPPSDVQEEVLR